MAGAMWDEVMRALEIGELETMYGRPSPAAPVVHLLDTMRGNAVLIDLAGGCRAMDVPEPWPPVVKVPIPVTWRVGVDNWAPLPANPVLEFELSSVQDGRAVYRQRR